MKYLWVAAVFIVGELVSFPIFAAVTRSIGPPKSSPARKASVAKGILERAVLLVGLLHGLPQILIAFGALKIGTRLKENGQTEISNNYFLVGNLISILLAMLYAVIAQYIWRG